MTLIIMLLAGVGLTISKVNGWFNVPDFCIWICFGVSAIQTIILVSNHLIIRKVRSKTFRQNRF